MSSQSMVFSRKRLPLVAMAVTVSLITLAGCLPFAKDASTDQTSSQEPVVMNGAEQDWARSADGMWQDREGVYIKRDNDIVLWSVDGTSNWQPSNGVWQGGDGNWYKLENGALMVSDSANGTWTIVNGQIWPGQDGITYRLDEEGTLWIRQSGTTTGSVDLEVSEAVQADTTQGVE